MLKSFVDYHFGNFTFEFGHLVSIFSLGVGRMWEGGEGREGKERGNQISEFFFK